jgi:hypothetical protein
MDRRRFLKSGATGPTALGSLPLMGKSLLAQTSQPANPILLKAVKRALDINGRAASVFGLMQDNGTHGVRIVQQPRLSRQNPNVRILSLGQLARF